MDNFGSLEEFLEKASKIPPSRPQTSFKSRSKNPNQPDAREKLSRRLNLESRHYGKKNLDRRPSGFIYQTPSRNNTREIHSAVIRKHSKVQNLIKRPKTSNSRTFGRTTSDSPEVKHLKPKKEAITVSLQEQVRNELLLNNQHYVIRSMKKIMRSDEQKEENGQKAKNTLFSRLAKKFEKLSENQGGKDLRSRKFNLKDDEVTSERRNWLKDHGYIGNDFFDYESF